MNQAAYNELIASLEFGNVTLSELTASSKGSDLGQATIRVQSEFTAVCLERHAQGFMAQARLVLSFLNEDTEVGNITCAYCLHYTSSVELTDEMFKEFSKFNVPANAWPFLREIVMTTTQRFGWSGFVLPPYKIPFSTPSESPAPKKKSARAAVPAVKKARS